MIHVSLFKKNGLLYGYEVRHHGRRIVCAAVSALAINTANSLESFTGDDSCLDINEREGLISLTIKTTPVSDKALLLLKSFELGVLSIQNQYPGDIEVAEARE